jgi:hypothetical protein
MWRRSSTSPSRRTLRTRSPLAGALLSTTVSVSSGSRSATRKRCHRRRSYGLSVAMAWASLLSPEMSCAQPSPGRTKVARACRTRRRATTGDTHKPAPLLANPHEPTPSSRSWRSRQTIAASLTVTQAALRLLTNARDVGVVRAIRRGRTGPGSHSIRSLPGQGTDGERTSACFLYNAMRSLFERAGFTSIRSKGLHHSVMRETTPSTPSTPRRPERGRGRSDEHEPCA